MLPENMVFPIIDRIKEETIDGVKKYAMVIPYPLSSQGYFYSTYNPKEHFTYNIHFKDDGMTPDNINNGEVIVDDNSITNQNIARAWAKVIEYHFSFEQVLPKEKQDYIEFYIPKYIDMSPQDYFFEITTGVMTGSREKFANITQSQFETLINTKIEKLPTKSAYIKDVASCRSMGDKSYSDMNVRELTDLFNLWVSQSEDQGAPWKDATMFNQHLYNCALYCKIFRPEKIDANGNRIPVKDEQGNIVYKNGSILYEHVSPYEFRRTLKMVNEVFNFKLPIEEGWYIHNKQTNKWEFIEFKEEVISNE